MLPSPNLTSFLFLAAIFAFSAGSGDPSGPSDPAGVGGEVAGSGGGASGLGNDLRGLGDDLKGLGGEVSGSGGDLIQPRAFPCPDKNDISPCTCLGGIEGFFILDLWCSQVPGDEELAAVFQAKFPYKKYRTIRVEESPAITGLPAGIFGNLTFREFNVINEALTYVDAGALSLSHEEAELMYFYYNDITSFPFDDLASFTNLKELRLYGNKISGFPSLSSQSLEVLSLGYNPLGGPLTDTTFINTPALREIHLYGAEITEVMSGTFAGLSKLQLVSLRENHLSALPEASFVMPGLPNTRIYLQNNTITTVAPNAIAGLSGGLVDLQDNLLTSFEELVWRPLLEGGVQLDLRGNPLTCGCDLAWLIRAGSPLLDLLDPESTCADGRLVVDLDPALFQDC